MAFEVGNLGAIKILKDHASIDSLDLTADFSLYSLNHQAANQLQDLGIHRFALSIEDDQENIQQHLKSLDFALIKPQAILFKDTPLFIAESCSLTALHGGCPTAKVCQYRTLELENGKGEKFFAAHEGCKTIVYGQSAMSWIRHLEVLESLGVESFRIDFLTRTYSSEQICSIFDEIKSKKSTGDCHDGNFRRRLL